MSISRVLVGRENGVRTCVKFSRKASDLTPSDVFDPYRSVINSVELCFEVDVSQYEADTVLPLLRSALDSWLSGATLTRVLAGER